MRIRLLLELFPQAKFIPIHRDPYAVFQSTRNMLTVNSKMHCLQRPRWDDFDASIRRQYRTMYEAFFEDRSRIPAGHYHEMSFEELERDPRGQCKGFTTR